MGLWGVHSFENDDAVEWATAYREMGLPVAKSTIDIALNDHADNRLTVELACRAVAGAEAIALVLGRSTQDSEKAFAGGPEADRGTAQAMVPDANNVIAALLESSALKEYWSDAGQVESWTKSLGDLHDRLNGEAPVAAMASTAPMAETEAAPVERASAVPGGDASIDAQMQDMREAILELSTELQTMRQEMSGNFRRLAKMIAERDQ